MTEGLRCIVGLGNPGRRYDKSRHNAGFWVVDALARKTGITHLDMPATPERVWSALQGHA